VADSGVRLMRRRVEHSWDENDAYTRWRRFLHWRPGQIKAIKRRTHRRERRERHEDIREQLE